MVGRLDLEKYKATIKGLTQFGDRRQGTEAQSRRRRLDRGAAQELRLHEHRAHHVHVPACPRRRRQPLDSARRSRRAATRRRLAATQAQGGGRIRGNRAPHRREHRSARAARRRSPRARLRSRRRRASAQEVYCTKIGTTHPDEMYIVGGHMDGHGWGEAANDDGSGTALVMELARIFTSPDVQTDRSIRFVLWNNEETGLNGARAYVEQRQALQGKESRRIGQVSGAEVARHDPARHDDVGPRHAARRRQRVSPEQRPEADVNIEFQSTSKMSPTARRSSRGSSSARTRSTRRTIPAQVGPHMTNTDSRAVPGPRPGDQPARERARRADRRRLESDTGTSRPTSTRRSATRTSGSV